MRTIKQYKRWTKDNPLLFNKLKEEQKITQIWYSKISGQLSWEPGEREELNRKAQQVAMEIDHIIGWDELKAMGR